MPTLYGTGLQLAEALALTKDDVALAGGAYHLRIVGKGQKPRFVPLLPAVREAIARYLRVRGDDEPALWSGERGPLTHDGAYEALTHRGLQAALAAMTAHDLDMLALRTLSGHADFKMLDRYVGHREQERASAALLRANHLADLFPNEKPPRKG